MSMPINFALGGEMTLLMRTLTVVRSAVGVLTLPSAICDAVAAHGVANAFGFCCVRSEGCDDG